MASSIFAMDPKASDSQGKLKPSAAQANTETATQTSATEAQKDKKAADETTTKPSSFSITEVDEETSNAIIAEQAKAIGFYMQIQGVETEWINHVKVRFLARNKSFLSDPEMAKALKDVAILISASSNRVPGLHRTQQIMKDGESVVRWNLQVNENLRDRFKKEFIRNTEDVLKIIRSKQSDGWKVPGYSLWKCDGYKEPNLLLQED